MADNIGSASLLIVPTFDGLTSKVNSALGSASGTASTAGSQLGQSTASGFGKGLSASGAVIGAFSAITTAAMSSISSHVDAAVSRFDTLNNYPKVMQALGYSSKEADASISTMSERLSALPTRLDDMVSTVQGIVAVTGDLDQATYAGLALNDMLVASGSSTQLTTAAMEQFRQILAKGKPEMEDWRSLTSAMPGQMNQLAEAMLGAGHSANDLYYALGGGKASDAPDGIEWASISVNDLLEAIIRLDNEGGEGITSFREQAETAAGGISTSMSNLSNAVTKGLTGVLDTIGKDNIAGVFNDMKTAVNSAFSGLNKAVSAAMPYVKQFYGAFKSNSGTILTAVASFSALSVGTDAVRGAFSKLVNTNAQTKTGFDQVKAGASGVKEAFALVKGGAGSVSEGFGLVTGSAKTMGAGVKGVLSGLVSAIDPVSLAVTGVTAAVSIGVAAYEDWKTKTETLEKATSGLNEAVSRTGALKDYAGTIEGVGQVSGTAAKSADELAESIAKSVDAMNENTAKAETTVATLNTAQGIIEKYAGKTDLSTEAQGKLEWAISQVNEQLGLTISQADVAAGCYTDQNGEVQNLTDSLSALITKKKEEAQAEALTANLTEAYTNRTQAAKTYAQAQADVNKAAQEYAQKMRDSYGVSVSYDDAVKAIAGTNTELGRNLASAKSQFEAADNACKAFEDQLGRASETAAGVSDSLSTLNDSQLTAVQGALSNTGRSVSDFARSLSALGVDTSQLADRSNEELMRLASDYDGTVTSIAGDLDEMGVKLYAAKEPLESFTAAFDGIDGLSDVFSGLGWDVDEFAQKCSDAGLTAEDFNGMTSESFAQLAANCNGSVDEMIAEIASYNSTPLIDKDGTVNVDDNTLVDAQGHVLTFNGTGLYDKTAGAYVDSATVVDSTGNVWVWDGTALVSKTADATITGNAVTGDAQGNADNTQAAIDRLSDKTATAQVNGNASDGSAAANIWNTVSAIGNLAGRTITNVIRNITRNDAAGGIRLNAAGGVRRHAGGAIVDNYGPGVPLDIVGEDGAEAIVPLTNKRYVTPFARTVAEQMGEVGGGSATAEKLERVVSLLEALLNKDGDVYLDSNKVSAALASRGRYSLAGRGLA